MEIASAVKHLKAFVSKSGTMENIMVSVFRNNIHVIQFLIEY